MRTKMCCLTLCLLLAGNGATRACWTFAYDPQGQLATQLFPGVVLTPFRLSSPDPGRYFEQLGFYDVSGDGLARDVVVGIGNAYGEAQVTIPAGPGTMQRDGFRWATLDHPFALDADGVNYFYYLGESGDTVRLANRFEVEIHPLFELAQDGYQFAGTSGPAFLFPPDSGRYAFGANGYTAPEPSSCAMAAITLLGAGAVVWRRRSGKHA